MGISNREWDHIYCRISPREAQYSSRQGISKKGPQRIEIKPQDISETVLCNASPRNRSFYHQSGNSALSVTLLENRTLEPGSRCISTKLGESKGICNSILFPSRSSSEESTERAGKPSSNCTSMAVTSMVSMPAIDVHKKSNFVAKVAKPFKKSSRGKSLISPKQLSAVGGMDSIRGKLLAKRISQESAEISSLSLGDSEQSLITNWSGESLVAEVLGKRVLQFLTEQLNEGW